MYKSKHLELVVGSQMNFCLEECNLLYWVFRIMAELTQPGLEFQAHVYFVSKQWFLTLVLMEMWFEASHAETQSQNNIQDWIFKTMVVKALGFKTMVY